MMTHIIWPISYGPYDIVNISQSLRVAISFISATKILGFLSFFCDICQYRNKISDFFEHFLRYGKYRKKGQKGAKIFVALLNDIATRRDYDIIVKQFIAFCDFVALQAYLLP